MRLKRLTRVARIKGVEIFFHWSTFLIGGLLIIGTLPHVHVAIEAVAAYLAVIMIHEWGHVIAARRYRCDVDSIEIYPILGITKFSEPDSRFAECVIAWGGVVAQLVVAAPFIAWVKLFGYTSSEQINAVFALLGYFSLYIAILNLLPIPPLDGARA